VAVGKGPYGIAISPDGSKVYVANQYSFDVSVIDTATNNITATINVGRLPFAFGQFIAISLTPVQRIQQMITDVQSLVTSGVLNKGQGDSLIAQLNAAINQVNNGNPKAATKQLNAFINEVNADIKAGILSPTDGQKLIDKANAIINALKTS
jgi:YVTN family beta-propeller protein